MNAIVSDDRARWASLLNTLSRLAQSNTPQIPEIYVECAKRATITHFLVASNPFLRGIEAGGPGFTSTSNHDLLSQAFDV